MSAMDINTRFETARAEGFAGFIGDIKQRYARYKTYRRTLEELESLTDRELADLNLSRAMIRSIAYKAAYDG